MGCPLVTVSVSGITFHKPVQVGHIVELQARPYYSGPHEYAHCGQLSARATRRHGEYEQTTSCLMVYVALDAEGRPMAVPKWEPSTPEDEALPDACDAA